MDWFEKHNMPYLERIFLNDSPKGLDHANSELKNLLLEGMVRDEFLKDQKKLYSKGGLKNKCKRHYSNPRCYIILCTELALAQVVGNPNF